MGQRSLRRETGCLYRMLRTGSGRPWFSFLPSPTAQLWLPSEMIKTKRISVSGIHFSPRCHLLPFLSCSFSSWESLLLHAFLLALRRFPVYTNYRCFHWGGGVIQGGVVTGKGERGRMGGGTLILLVKIPRKRKETK